MTALADRMRELDATDAAVGKLIGRGAEQVESWRKGESEIDAEGRVLLRTFLADDPHAARLAIEKLRRTFHRTYEQGDRGALESTISTVGPVVHDGERSDVPALPNAVGRVK